jgi:hypothetical protein
VVPGADLVIDGGQGQFDGIPLLFGGDPVRGDELGGQDLLLAVRRHVVHLAEQHGVALVRLHVDADGR